MSFDLLRILSLLRWNEERKAWERSGELPPVVQLGGGEIGYGMAPYRYDDCLQAAIATVTQTPFEQVPDLRLRERLDRGEAYDEVSLEHWERIRSWAHRRGFGFNVYDEVPLAQPRWIGIINPDHLRRNRGHTLVMCHDELLFDPICTVKPPPGERRLHFPPSMIGWGVSFTRERNTRCQSQS